MVGLLYASVSSLDMAVSRGFVYVLAARAGTTAVFYVGQTRQRSGALGRLSQHLSDSESATFRQRVEAVTEAEVTGEVVCAAFPLSLEPAFQREAADYREAAEYRIEGRLREFVVNTRLPALSVARVAVHPYADSPIVIREAEKAFAHFAVWLESRIHVMSLAGGS